MKKTWMNFWVDISMFVGFVLMTIIGFIVKYALPPGTGGRYGGERAKMILGMTRHDWGDIHFIIGIIIIVLLTIHIILHWDWIICRFRELTKGDS